MIKRMRPKLTLTASTKGTVASVVKALQPLVKEKGPLFVSYKDEREDKKKAKRIHSSVVENIAYLEVLNSVHASLQYNKKCMQKVHQEIAEQKITMAHAISRDIPVC